MSLRELHKQRRVDQILAATRELIRADPDREPTVEAIARRAEVAPATVFNLVGPRERIWAALADEAMREARERIATAAEPDPHRRARLIATSIAETLLADAPVHRLVLAHWSQSGALIRENPVHDLRSCLEEAGAAEADSLARHIATACTGAVHQWAASMIDAADAVHRCALAVDITFAAARISLYDSEHHA